MRIIDELDSKVNQPKVTEPQVGSFVAPLYRFKTQTEPLTGLVDLKRICDAVLKWWEKQDQSGDVPDFVRIAKDLYNLK